MNLTDLTTELQDRAGDPVGPVGVPAVNRLSGVRQRIRVRRHRQAATAAGIAALSVAAIVLASGLPGISADRTSTPATTASPAPRSPFLFATDLAGDPLVESSLGAPGQQELVVRFTPKATNLAFSMYCRLPVSAAGEDGLDDVEIALTVNGHSFSQTGCSPDAGANENLADRGDDPQVSLTAWKLDGLEIGRESVFRLRVTDPKPDFDPAGQIRLGLGVYLLSAPRVKSNGVHIPESVDSDGHRYKLAGFKTTVISTSKRRLVLAIPAGRYPVMVSWGMNDPDSDGDLPGSATLKMDGVSGLGTSDNGVILSDPLPDAGAHTVAFQADKVARGVMQIAYYVRID